MALVSEKTFEVEGKSFRNIPGIFWESEREYPIDPFSGILEGLDIGDLEVERPEFLSDAEQFPNARDPEIRHFRRDGLLLLDRKDAMKRIGEATGNSDTDFAEALWDSLGIDISEELERSADSGLPSGRSLQDLTAKFGTHAFGTYCPWHTFGRSSETPWGFYVFFEKLIEWADALHRSGQFLPDPKPSLLKVFQLLWLVTYRHELFHFHVERYATRLESALRCPIYRPYVERVRTPVMNSENWLEEALAQAVVLRTTYVKKAHGIDSHYLKSYIVPYFLTFPNGYKHFQCKHIPGGEAGAHRLLSAQIARTEIDIPEEAWNIDLSLAKSEYQGRREAVPGYLLMKQQSMSRFQLQTPRLKDVDGKLHRAQRRNTGFPPTQKYCWQWRDNRHDNRRGTGDFHHLPLVMSRITINHNNGHEIFSAMGVAPVTYMTSSFYSGNPARTGSIIEGSAILHFADPTRHCRRRAALNRTLASRIQDEPNIKERGRYEETARCRLYCWHERTGVLRQRCRKAGRTDQ